MQKLLHLWSESLISCICTCICVINSPLLNTTKYIIRYFRASTNTTQSILWFTA